MVPNYASEDYIVKAFHKLIDSQRIVDTRLQHPRKLCFNVFRNINCQPLVCHLVQTDGFKILHSLYEELQSLGM